MAKQQKNRSPQTYHKKMLTLSNNKPTKKISQNQLLPIYLFLWVPIFVDSGTAQYYVLCSHCSISTSAIAYFLKHLF